MRLVFAGDPSFRSGAPPLSLRSLQGQGGDFDFASAVRLGTRKNIRYFSKHDSPAVSFLLSITCVGSHSDLFVIAPDERCIKAALERRLHALSSAHTVQQLCERITAQD